MLCFVYDGSIQQLQYSLTVSFCDSNPMDSSIPDHKLQVSLKACEAAAHFRYTETGETEYANSSMKSTLQSNGRMPSSKRFMESKFRLVWNGA